MNNPYTAPTADLTLAESDTATYQPRIFALTGRVGRLRYLAYSMLLALLASIPYIVYVGMTAVAGNGSLVLMLVMLVPMFAVTVLMASRRFTDVGRSRWWAALMIIPYVSIIPGFYLLFKRGDQEANEYGPPPCANSRGVIAGALILPIIMVIGILAAVAIPAYQDYVHKAQSVKSSGSKL